AVHPGEELRLAFDGDAVLFDHETERFYMDHGLDAFLEREGGLFNTPLGPGPMVPFVRALNAVQKRAERKLFRMALVTARQGQASERAIRTLLSWGIHVDEAHFCG